MLVALPPARQTHVEKYREKALPALNRADRRARERALRLAYKKDLRLEALKASRKA